MAMVALEERIQVVIRVKILLLLFLPAILGAESPWLIGFP